MVSAKVISVGIFVLLVIGTAFLFTRARFSSCSICSDCGEFLYETDYQIPFTHITYKRSYRTGPSPISTALAQAGFHPPHEHHWVFVQGSGNGVTCAIGLGSHMLRSTRDPMLVQFFSALAKNEDANTTAAIVEQFLIPDKANDLLFDLYGLPTSIYTDPAAWKIWRASRADPVSQLFPAN